MARFLSDTHSKQLILQTHHDGTCGNSVIQNHVKIQDKIITGGTMKLVSLPENITN